MVVQGLEISRRSSSITLSQMDCLSPKKPKHHNSQKFRLYPIPRLLEHFEQSLLSAAFVRVMHVHPPGRQRQAHQNTLHSRARRTETEARAPVVDQVEFHISAPSQLLPFLFRFRERHVFSPFNEGEVGGKESYQAIFDEGEELFLLLFSFVQVVEEYASDTAGLASVGNVEVFIAPLFEAGVVASIVLIACLFDRAVEVDGILVKQIRRGKICAPAKPPGVAIAFCVHRFKIAVVEVHGWCIGVLGVQDTTEACCEEFETLDIWV